jgi:hypothetical protein
MKIEVNSEEELQHYKDRTLMLKMICLDAMGENVMADVSNFSKRQKIKLQVEIEKRWNDTNIVEKFNELCVQTIFEDGKMEIEKLPVIQCGFPEEPEEQKEYRLKCLENLKKNQDTTEIIV